MITGAAAVMLFGSLVLAAAPAALANPHGARAGRAHGNGHSDHGPHQPPGHAGKAHVPPGQANKTHIPPGQANKTHAPPGQANKTHVPPGQANKTHVPPGQANKTHVPPGHADEPHQPAGQSGEPHGKPGEHGKPGQPHGKPGEHGKPGQPHGKPGEHGKSGRSHGKSNPGRSHKAHKGHHKSRRQSRPPAHTVGQTLTGAGSEASTPPSNAQRNPVAPVGPSAPAHNPRTSPRQTPTTRHSSSPPAPSPSPVDHRPFLDASPFSPIKPVGILLLVAVLAFAGVSVSTLVFAAGRRRTH